MNDWRFYFAFLHVSLLPIPRAGAVEVSLSPSSLSWYFGFLETYVFPFILAASIALLIGYGISRLLESSQKVEEAGLDADAGMADMDASAAPLVEQPPAQVGDAPGGAEGGPQPDQASDLSHALRAAVEAAEPVPAALTSGALLERISARASEQALSGDPVLDPTEDAPVLENSDALVRRISARVTEQVMDATGVGNGAVAAVDETSTNKLDSLLQRIGARAADESAAGDSAADESAADQPAAAAVDEPLAASNGAVSEADADDGRSPAERLDALLARIGAPPPEEAMEPIPHGTEEAAPAVGAEDTPTDRLDSLIQRIGARASGQPVEDVEVPPVEGLPAAGRDVSPADKLDALMKRIGSGAAPETPAIDDDALEPAGAPEPTLDAEADQPETGDIEVFAEETSDLSDALSTEPLDEADPLSPVVLDDELPDIDDELDTAMDEIFEQRVEPTIAPLDDSPAEHSAEAAFEPPADTGMEAPIDVEPEPPVESAADMPIDIEPEAFTESAPDAPIHIEAEPPVESAADMPIDIEPEAFTESAPDAPIDIEAEAPVEPAEDMPVDIEPEAFTETAIDTPAEPSAEMPVEIDAGAPVDSAAESSFEEESEPPAWPVLTEPAEFVPEPEFDVAAEAATEPEEEPSDETGMEIPEEPDSLERPVLERLVDRDLEPVEDDRWASKVAAALMGGRHTEAEEAGQESAIEDAVAAHPDTPEAMDTPTPGDLDDTGDTGPPPGGAVEPITAVEAEPDPDVAAGMAARVATEFDETVAALQRFNAIVEGYETAREGLDLEAMNRMRLTGAGLPEGAESVLRRLGDEISGAAIAGYSALDRFNHIVEQLAQMAGDAPLDEGWNELLEDRISETIAVVGGVCKRLREVASGEPGRAAGSGEGPSGNAGRRSNADDPPGFSVGGE